ncbi:hypothetical protein BDQ17DRAFT_1412929 [Cyathus striatus]|nr:hypothetical protein BDQ17DRAFT_1412929 [Cyathus striatus]
MLNLWGSLLCSCIACACVCRSRFNPDNRGEEEEEEELGLSGEEIRTAAVGVTAEEDEEEESRGERMGAFGGEDESGGESWEEVAEEDGDGNGNGNELGGNTKNTMKRVRERDAMRMGAVSANRYRDFLKGRKEEEGGRGTRFKRFKTAQQHNPNSPPLPNASLPHSFTPSQLRSANDAHSTPPSILNYVRNSRAR